METTVAEPQVSIVIATFNAASVLPGCLQSIMSLSLNQVELVFVDGGSTDDTLLMIQQCQQPLKQWISEPDKGIYDAYNKGAKMARGKWIHFLGADDRLLPGFREMLQQLRQPDTVYYGNSEAYYLGDQKPKYVLLGGRFNRYRLSKYPVNHQAILYPSAVFQTMEYDLRYKVFADYAMSLRLWRHPRFRVQYYPVHIVRYNMTGFSSTLHDDTFFAEKENLIKENLGNWVYWRYKWKKWRKKVAGEPRWQS